MRDRKAFREPLSDAEGQPPGDAPEASLRGPTVTPASRLGVIGAGRGVIRGHILGRFPPIGESDSGSRFSSSAPMALEAAGAPRRMRTHSFSFTGQEIGVMVGAVTPFQGQGRDLDLDLDLGQGHGHGHGHDRGPVPIIEKIIVHLPK